MKILIPAILMLSYQSLVMAGDDETNQYCYYANQQYSPGSILLMNTINRECRDKSFEHKRALFMSGEKKEYLSPNSYDHSLQWRKPVNVPNEIKPITITKPLIRRIN